MLDDSESLKFLATYWSFALATAGSFYSGVVWFGRHLSQGSKDTLTLWLWGEYESTWSHHFCNMFDAVFGNRHWSWQCFLRSSVASVLAVLLLFVLLDEILGVMGVRALGNLSLWQAVLFGAAINIIPDYLSLFETRWLLKRFERVQSVIGQLGVLFADAVFTGTIIWLALAAFQLLRGDAVLSAVEMLALFSVFSLFFYSTFLTSVWAWIYCLSTWFMRLFSRSLLRNVLDVETKPVHQIALVGSAVVFAAALVLAPVLKAGDAGQANRFDDLLCSIFDVKICLHVARGTPDPTQAFRILSRVCESIEVRNGESIGFKCFELAARYLGGDETKVRPIWSNACDGGYMLGCDSLGWMYEEGRGVERNEAQAVLLYRRACDGGYARGCYNLGAMYDYGRGVARDEVQADSLYVQACEGGNTTGCYALALNYILGGGVLGGGEEQYEVYAVSYFLERCEDGNAVGCAKLGEMYEYGRGVEPNMAKAVTLYRQACGMGYESACTP